MKDLQDKNILFFAPTFFGYEAAITQKLKQLGARVDYFDERPENDFITKASIRVNRNLILKKLNNYYQGIIRSVAQKKYDYILVVGLEAMLPSALEALKIQHPNAVLIVYMWDSLKNKKYASLCLPFFDHIFSFDKGDALEIPGIKFRPLFFIDKYDQISQDSHLSVSIDLCFIGTIHSDRYNLIKEVQNQSDALQLKNNFYMYFPSSKLFFYKKISDKRFRHAKFKEFKFKSLSQDSITRYIKDAKVILDIQHPSQTGLTMRTIEMLGANRKIITTNTDIKNYDFYNAKNIFILDRNNPKIDKSFFETCYEQIDPQIKFNYSIEGWIRELFNLTSPFLA
ncbi:hypothetical protein [Dyadobacter sp. CY356]|uniref:hypothetical protein n=1 Tax=Dyadobacter sp. CY356 TaxID=2906442 RepID=UPI001F3334BF|nr:hypothetical protein [Dyadobacter sp. CY356]MCF0058319.1 hypothetical protein [Dyadobacter sp. CY356]